MKILLCTDGSAYAQVSYEYVAWWAKRLDNPEIKVLYVTDHRKEKAVKTKDFSGSIGVDAYQQLLDKLVEIESDRAKLNHQRAKYILHQAQDFLGEHGIEEVQTIHETGFLIDLFHQFEADTDVIVLGKRGETANFATEHLGVNMERLVRASHKPCLVTPREFKPINRVLLAYDGGISCQKALNYISKSPIFKELELHIMMVANKKKASATEQVQVAQEIAELAGLKPICQVLSGEPEAMMEEYIDQHDIDFLIMGAYGHSRIRNLVIGSTTAQILRGSHIPVLLFR